MIFNISNIRSEIRLICILMFLFQGVFETSDIRAQGFNIYNPADRFQPWVSEINPAIIAMQDARISAGLKVFHLGFLPEKDFGLKESHFNVTFPFSLPLGLGVGCDMRYYSAGIFSEISSSLLLSKKIFNRFSIGVKMGLIRVGFSRQHFIIVDDNDPLLTGNLAKNSFNLGFGAFCNPGRWAIGVAINNANRPNIGFRKNANLPLEVSAAIGYKVGRITPTFLIQDVDKCTRYGLAVSVKYNRLGVIRFSYEDSMPLKIELQLNLLKKSSLLYALDLPNENMRSVSMGSHELTFNYIFSNDIDIATPKIIISTNKMKIFEETVIRSMAPDLLPGEIEKMTDLTPVYLDTRCRNQNLLIISTGALNRFENEVIKKQRYTELGNEIMLTLHKHPDLELVLRADEDFLKDAQALKRYLINKKIVSSKSIKIVKVKSSGNADLYGFQQGHSITKREKPALSAEKLIISLAVPGRTRSVRNWKLLITDTKNGAIKTYTGEDKLPKQLEWNWKNDRGELVLPGRYKCTLQMKAKSGREMSISSQPLQVIHVKRSIILRFKHQHQIHVGKID